MRTIIATALLVLAAPLTWAQDEEEEEEGDDEEEEEEEEETKPAPAAPKPAGKDAGKKREEFKKQDLRGHDVDPDKIANPFQKDRFFVDKVDTKATEKGTLTQGSLQLSGFAYRESSDKFPGMADQGTAASKFDRYFGDARLQTDFRHIGGGNWDARIDTRGRYVNQPGTTSPSDDSADPNRVQSGFNGDPEIEVREAWLVRSGKRTDLFFGRQFVPDLGAVKIDGVRFDYASSERLTLLGFAGGYPVRGSRSITTDYPKLRTSEGDDPLTNAGRLVGAGGFGAAYRTMNAHGAVGGVAIVPLSSERPRVYASSNGYFRAGTKLDLFHYAILDVFGANADPIALTNLSAGVNYKPGSRLRLTAAFHRVDTESLNVQAGAFLDNPIVDVAEGATKVQNETIIQLKRISTNMLRVSASFGLGDMNRFEITIASAFRYRPALTLTPANLMAPIELEAAQGVDVYGSVMDRRSFLNLRVGLDASRSIAVGDTAFARSEILTGRVFASREIGKGRGEWEAEISYATTRDRHGNLMGMCGAMSSPADCFGVSNAKVFSVGGQVYYRVKEDIFAIGNLYVQQVGVDSEGAMPTKDPPILSLMGFARVAYRF